MDLSNRPIKDPYQEIPVKDFSYINTQSHPPKKTSRKGWIILAVIILILLGVGAFAYGHYTKTKTNKPAQTSSHKKVTTTKSNSTSNVPLTSYTSTNLNLTLSYPTNWTVSEEGTSSLEITSPQTSLIADTGKTVTGREVVTISNQNQLPTGFGTSSVAVLNSQDINFNKPTSSQAAQTYVSFVQYPATNIKGGLDGIYITGNNGFLKDQAITSANVDSVSPLVIVSFQQCLNTDCTNSNDLTISSTMWSNSSFSTPILDIFKSLTFS